MRVEVLRRIPVSGTVAERQFRASARANLWVRFEPDDGPEWVGVFGSAELAQYHAAVLFPDGPPAALVIAGGQGYVVDGGSGTLLRETPWAYAFSAVPVAGRAFVLVADNTRIWATYRDRDIAAVRRDDTRHNDATRLALDGIVFDPPGAASLAGYVWEPEGWYAFTLRYDGLAFELGDLVTRDWGAIEGSVERGGYPPPSDDGASSALSP